MRNADDKGELVRTLEIIRKFVPPLTGEKHKGQSGKIGVVGGCKEYTGAPYFAAISALKVGADLSHVFCTSAASTVIKSYSPELIVHPVLRETEDREFCSEVKESIVQKSFQGVKAWLPRIDCLVIGPGLGRDEMISETVELIINYAKEISLPLVIDGDGLFIVTNNLALIQGNTEVILTPNVNEFNRLTAAMECSSNRPESLQALASKLGGVTVLQKGAMDVISDGNYELSFGQFSSLRRCGGQGDIVAGTVAAFMAWANKLEPTADVSKVNPAMIACLGASLVVRKSSFVAFCKHKRSMLASDVIQELGGSMEEFFPATAE